MRSYKTRAFGPVGALLWENWRLTYLAFFVALLMGAGVTHSLSEMHRVQPESINDPVLPSYAICAFALFLYGSIVLYSLADPKALSARIPIRHYCLPLRTGTTVAVNLAYRAVSFSLLAAALFTLMRVEFGDLIGHGLALDAAVALTAISYVVAVAWSWGVSRPWVTALLIAVLPAIAIGLAMKTSESRHATQIETVSSERLYGTGEQLSPGIAYHAAHGDETRLATQTSARVRGTVEIGPFSELRRHWSTRVWDWLATQYVPSLCLLSAAYLAFAYASGVRGRLGSVAGGHTSSAVSRLFGTGPRITSSAQQAQVWYEWRRKGLVLPGVTLGLTFLFFLVALIDDGRAADLRYLLIVPVYVAPFAAFFTGLYMLSVDYRHASSGLSTFLYTRPLSTDAYTRARLRMSAKSVLLTICLCLTLAVAGLAGGNYQTSISMGSINVAEVPVVIFAFLAYGLLLWSLLWMSLPVVAYLLWFGCYFYYQTLASPGFEQTSEHVHMFWLVWIPAVALVAVTAVVWRYPAMWKSLSNSTVTQARRAMVVALIAMAACAWKSGAFVDWSVDVFEQVTLAVAIVGLSMLPALSILSQPLLLDRLRRK